MHGLHGLTMQLTNSDTYPFIQYVIWGLMLLVADDNSTVSSKGVRE